MTEIANYDFEQIKIGHVEEFNVFISENMVNEFAKISGDLSPIHVDEEYGLTTQFGQRVCHGMLLASFFSRLVGMKLPGRTALYVSQSLNFVSPCFIDQEVIVRGEVVSKSTATRIITLKTSIRTSYEKELVRGEAKVLVRKEHVKK